MTRGHSTGLVLPGRGAFQWRPSRTGGGSRRAFRDAGRIDAPLAGCRLQVGLNPCQNVEGYVAGGVSARVSSGSTARVVCIHTTSS